MGSGEDRDLVALAAVRALHGELAALAAIGEARDFCTMWLWESVR